MLKKHNIIEIIKHNLFYIVSIISLAIYSALATLFVWHNNLSSFASDSANYMLMGLYMSPWKEASLPIQALWLHQDFPPFYPFILGITGVAHNFIAAHLITLVFLIISFYTVYLFTKQCIASHWHAFAITCLFALSPSSWMNMLGILSENLYLLISFIILVTFPKITDNKIQYSVLLGCLLSILILTRTIGISLFLAYVIVAYFMWKKSEIQTKTYFLPIILTVFINLSAKLLHQSSVPSQYIKQFSDLNFNDQLIALVDAWFSSWQFYWVDNLIVLYLIVSIIGIFACISLFVRCRMLKLDAVYVLIYLLILLVWPHPGQALRFIYPIQALLLIYAFFLIFHLFKNYSFIQIHKVLTVLLLAMAVVVLPPLSFLYNRHKVGEENGFNHIKEFYRFPDIKTANINAATQIEMFNDMEYIKNNTKKNDLILYFEPTYIALLSNRYSKRIYFEYDNQGYHVNKDPDADYIYLSRIHPRKTRTEINGLDMIPYVRAYSENVWTHYSSENNEPVSSFMKIIK